VREDKIVPVVQRDQAIAGREVNARPFLFATIDRTPETGFDIAHGNFSSHRNIKSEYSA
jgi:hypothetical protein